MATPVQAHCMGGGIAGAVHDRVMHGSNCAAMEDEPVPREQLDEPEPEVASLRLLDVNLNETGTVELGAVFHVEVIFTQAPEASSFRVTVAVLDPDGAARSERTIGVRRLLSGSGKVFRSAPISLKGEAGR